MKQTTIKLADSTRYDLPPKNDLEFVEKYGEFFVKFHADGVTRFINSRHIVWIKETEVDG